MVSLLWRLVEGLIHVGKDPGVGVSFFTLSFYSCLISKGKICITLFKRYFVSRLYLIFQENGDGGLYFSSDTGSGSGPVGTGTNRYLLSIPNSPGVGLYSPGLGRRLQRLFFPLHCRTRTLYRRLRNSLSPFYWRVICRKNWASRSGTASPRGGAHSSWPQLRGPLGGESGSGRGRAGPTSWLTRRTARDQPDTRTASSLRGFLPEAEKWPLFVPIVLPRP